MTLTPGRTVLYRISETEVRPAIVLKDWGSGCLQLQVFFDGSNDRPECGVPEVAGVTPSAEERDAGLGWRTSINEGDSIGEWSWPPRV